MRAAIDFMVREIRSAGRDATVCAFDYATSSTVDCDGVKVANCTARLAGSGTPTWETANGLGGPGLYRARCDSVRPGDSDDAAHPLGSQPQWPDRRPVQRHHVAGLGG